MRGTLFGAALWTSLISAMIAGLALSFLMLVWLGKQSAWPEEAVAVGQLLAIAAGIACAAISAKRVLDMFQRHVR